MKTYRIITAVLALLLSATPVVAGAQGKGQGKGANQGKGKDKVANEVRKDLKEARKDLKEAGKDMKDFAKGKNRDRVIVSESHGNVGFREYSVSQKRGQRLAGLAVASAARHHNDDDAFVITPVGDRVHVLNRSGVVLVDWDDDRELGNWKVVSENFKDKKGAPSFCRSGAGHPVWGRQWCIEKGFGLGVDDDLRWSRIIDPSNVIITRPTTTNLTRDVLMDVLGSVVLNRFATHAVTLGLQDPLTGRWLGETTETGPRVLLLSSGTRPVAELVDVNRDNRADLVLVSVRK